MKIIKDVRIIPGCIGCGNCEAVCPKVFAVNGQSKVISRDWKGHEDGILTAARECPVQVIQVETEDEEKGGASSRAPSNQIKVVLKEKKEIAKGVWELQLEVGKFSLVPGQYIIIYMEDGEGNFARCYSVAGYAKGLLKLCIKIVDGGRGGGYILGKKEGDDMKISLAQGKFTLQNTNNPKLFIGTGTGLAPLLTMLDALEGKSVQKKILMGVRSEEDMFYEKKLKRYKRLEVVYTLSRPADTWTGDRGRVTDHLGEIIDPSTEVYICGNPHMVDSVVESLKKIGHPEEHIYKEEFTKALAGAETKSSEKSWFRQVILEGKIPFAAEMRSMIFYSAFAVPLGLPWLSSGFRELGFSGWWVLNLVMLMRPLADVFPQIGIFRSLVPWRRELGILSATLILAHSYGYFLNGKLSILETLSKPSYWAIDKHFLWGTVGMVAGIIVLLFSNRFSMRLFGSWWKRFQKLTYIFFFFGGIHIAIFRGGWDTVPVVWIILVLWLLAEMKFTFIFGRHE